MKPTIGRVVIYKMTAQEKEDLKSAKRLGLISCNADQDQLPATVVAAWSDTCINLQVNLDGNQSIWKTSVKEGEAEGTWNWPVIVQ